MGHQIELGQVPDGDVELASGAIDSLAITGEAVTHLLAAQLRAFLAQSANPAGGPVTCYAVTMS